ncbi:MAG: hypothetical protein J5829_07105 [Lachnospiraceae bacterium]|nr:hypothetical protein [Lachnospiraceae bacterium]
MAENNLPTIQNGTVPNILFLGNGLNQAFGEASWDRVIEMLSTGEFDYDETVFAEIQKMPYALQTILISSDSVNEGMSQIAESMLPRALSPEHSELLHDYTKVGFDAILTTNYSYEIETSLNPEFSVSLGKASKYRFSSKTGSRPQEQFGIYKYYYINNCRIWHVHGEAAHPNSMVMGHYYYGKLLSEIQKRVPEVIRTYSACKKKEVDFIPQSWIDYFLIGNVYIVGFGLNPSEMDIWWLINCKKRHFPEAGKIYFYEPNLDDIVHYPVRALAETFKFNYGMYHVKDYYSFYKMVLSEIRTESKKWVGR